MEVVGKRGEEWVGIGLGVGVFCVDRRWGEDSGDGGGK